MVDTITLINEAHEAVNAAKGSSSKDASTHALLAIAALLEAIELQLGEVTVQIQQVAFSPKGG